MQAGGLPRSLKPCTLPSNDYAFTHQVYLSPTAHQTFSSAQSPPSTQLFLEINGLLLRAQPLKFIAQSQIGLSKFQRDCLMISKDDEVMPRLAKIVQ